MKRRSALAIAAAVVGLLVVPMLAAGLSGTDRPFRAVLTGAAHWEWPGAWPSGCTMVTTVTEATGQATHLGRVVATMSHCPAEADHVLDGWMTITAANGDTLIGRYDYDPYSTSLSFPVSWAGGTGRFAGAAGSVAGSFTVTPQFIAGCNPDPDPFACYDFSVPWPWSATMSGTISY
jgi:hypothetical protein